VAWSTDQTTKFAEFSNQSGDVGPLKVTISSVGYDIEIQSEHSRTFVDSPVLSRSLDELETSVRTHNCLKNLGIKKVGDLITRTESELLASKNFGKKSLNELKDILRSMGLQFGMDVPTSAPSREAANLPYRMKFEDFNVSVYDELNNFIFESPDTGERPLVASYSSRDGCLAVGTREGRVLVWDVKTAMNLADLEQGKLACTGLRVCDAKGLDQLSPDSSLSLGEWLHRRGALLTRKQH
jgi:hypothetical protein